MKSVPSSLTLTIPFIPKKFLDKMLSLMRVSILNKLNKNVRQVVLPLLINSINTKLRLYENEFTITQNTHIKLFSLVTDPLFLLD